MLILTSDDIVLLLSIDVHDHAAEVIPYLIERLLHHIFFDMGKDLSVVLVGYWAYLIELGYFYSAKSAKNVGIMVQHLIFNLSYLPDFLYLPLFIIFKSLLPRQFDSILILSRLAEKGVIQIKGPDLIHELPFIFFLKLGLYNILLYFLLLLSILLSIKLFLLMILHTCFLLLLLLLSTST